MFVAGATASAGPPARIVLSAGAIETARKNKSAGTDAWRNLRKHCDEVADTDIPPGYEAWDWATAALDAATCWRVEGQARDGAAGVRYLRALLDDRQKMGDVKGGNEIVRHDSGYPIRTHGALAALALDGLTGAPGLDATLRKHALDRFVAFVDWYAANGYQRNAPIANYYAGYFATIAYAGLAMQGEDPRADEYLKRARKMWADEIVPTYKKLAGGDFPEGWQYGDLVGTFLSIYAGAEGYTAQLPWLGESIAFHTHALLPGGKMCWDAGDWSKKPASMPPHAMLALALALPDKTESDRALALARLAANPNDDFAWLVAIADDPTRHPVDPRAGARSYLSSGTATFTARSSWASDAIWVAMAATPTISDHQHLDAGHFEVARGDDRLLIDAGGYASFSTLSHNTFAVWADKKRLVYAPNQGPWSDSAGLVLTEDKDDFVYAVADFAGAWNQPGYPKERSDRAVRSARRTMVFSRNSVPGLSHVSGRIVMLDRLVIDEPSDDVAMLLHGGPKPEQKDHSLRFLSGHSELRAHTLLPKDATYTYVDEGKNAEADIVWYNNLPPELDAPSAGSKYETSIRVEIRAPKGTAERTFLHAMIVGDAGATSAAAASLLSGSSWLGAAVADEGYVFVDGKGPWALAAPTSVRKLWISGLAAQGRYDFKAKSAAAGCEVTVTTSTEASTRASSAGTFVLDVSRCHTP